MKKSFISIIVLLIAICAHAQTITLGKGINDGVVITTSHESVEGSADNTLSTRGFAANLNATSRFLSQATFGSSYEDIEAVQALGLEDWIDEQFQVPVGERLTDEVIRITEEKNIGRSDPEGGPFLWFFNDAWWNYHFNNEDELRQRMAFALSELLVVSQFSALGDRPYALSTYYDMLLNNSFGNYRTLLDSVTYHSGMGEYLTYMNNSRTDTLYEIDYDVWPFDTLDVQFTFPDENYAREVMQLFSIGLFELNNDGTRKKDDQGQDIPTYDNADIAELAKVFTGFSYGDNDDFNRGPGEFNTTYFMPMQIYEEYHERGPKQLLNGFVIPERSGPDWPYEDVKDALDHLFNHDNVGPFVGQFLIQRFVTSNPSPAYVSRVADAFNGDGPFGTERGDLKSVLKAILLDDEARTCAFSEASDAGKMREPFIRYVQIGKAFDGMSTGGRYRNVLFPVYDLIEQAPLSSPSVFNFFQSDFQPIGAIEDADRVAPEFQITNAQSIAGYLNGLTDWLINERYATVWQLYDDEPDIDSYRTNLEFSDELGLVDAALVPQLVERLNLILAHGKLSEETIDIITEAVREFDLGFGDEVDRAQAKVRFAVLLVMASPDYLINR